MSFIHPLNPTKYSQGEPSKARPEVSRTGPVFEDRSTSGARPKRAPSRVEPLLRAAQTLTIDRFGAVGYQLLGTAGQRSQRETRAAYGRLIGRAPLSGAHTPAALCGRPPVTGPPLKGGPSYQWFSSSPLVKPPGPPRGRVGFLRNHR